jgi:hypothetical protein
MSSVKPEEHYKSLLPFAVDATQRELLETMIEHKTSRAAAEVLGKYPTNVRRSIRRIEQRAAKMGHSPEADKAGLAPEGYMVKGKSTYYDKDGAVRGQWVKTNVDAEKQLQIMRDVVDELTENVRPKPVPAHPTLKTKSDLLNLYTMTDSHIGMLSWGKETGKDWDLEIAEATLTGCFKDMVDRAPAADTAVIAQLGDWLHYDSLDPMTPTSGHVLDADSRAGKMVAVACRALESLVDMALEKHSKVILVIAEGNHDLYGSLWLRTMFRRLYRDNPRVEIVESENPYYAMRWGVTMLGWHHGHKKRPGTGLAEVFSSMYRKMWGEAEHCVIHTGDLHHKSEKEHAGFTLLQHGTLAANDAYAIRGGWRSDQYAEAITYHMEFGEAGRTRTTPAMIGM